MCELEKFPVKQTIPWVWWCAKQNGSNYTVYSTPNLSKQLLPFGFAQQYVSPTQQTQNICIPFVQCRPNVFDVFWSNIMLCKCFVFAGNDLSLTLKPVSLDSCILTFSTEEGLPCLSQSCTIRGRGSLLSLNRVKFSPIIQCGTFILSGRPASISSLTKSESPRHSISSSRDPIELDSNRMLWRRKPLVWK